MTALPHEQASPRSVRLDTLVRLRWLAILGQLCAVLFVDFGLDFELPLWGCLAVIGLYAAFTVAIRMELDGPQRLEAARAGWLLAIDVAEIALLLALTGGLQNPFAFLLVGPVLISATALPSHMALLLAGFTTACATLLLFVHLPLPWSSDDPLTLPPVYMLGVWISILLAIGYISIYAWQVTEQARQLANALTATELVLAREKHLSQLDGLAAAAAHELGTPLSTIAVVAKELQLALANSQYGDDVRLLRDQAQRCRDILSKLTELPAPGEPFEHMSLSALIEEVVAPHRDFGVTIVVNRPTQSGEPTGARNPAILYGLGNLVENAVDFAKSRVEVTPSWTATEVSVTVRDDGPGFSAEVMPRIGEPYVRGRRGQRMPVPDDEAGLGLGFFIAKTLLQRTGAHISVANNTPPDTGASIRISWQRKDFEVLAGSAGRTAPLSPDTDQHTYHPV